MQRYFVNPEQFADDKVIITGDDVHHITKVLRLKVGDHIICSNGLGIDALSEIIQIDSTQVLCNIVSILDKVNESNINIILAQSLPKADKMDLIIQKGTEIGISSFLPFISERTIVRLDDKKEQKRLERWQKIAKEAAEQAHRNKIPEILPVSSWKDLLAKISDQLTLIAYEKEAKNFLYQTMKNNPECKNILLIIGPEGGFSEKEIKEAEDNGATSVSLGKTILRAETAGLVGAANIIYHLEGLI